MMLLDEGEENRLGPAFRLVGLGRVIDPAWFTRHMSVDLRPDFGHEPRPDRRDDIPSAAGFVRAKIDFIVAIETTLTGG